MDIEEIRAAAARVTAPGRPYELIDAQIDGVAFRVFKNAPASLRELYRSSLAQHASRDFYVFRDERFTFQEAWDLAARVAHALTARGIRKGDRVAIAARNYPEWIFAYMGITSIGAIAVAMNAWWSREELAYGLDDSGARLIFADRERLERIAPIANERGLALVAIRADDLARDGVATWRDFIANCSTVMPTPALAPDDDAMLLYTSGSTAHPKGVLTTHRSIIHAVLGWECGAVIAADVLPELVDPSPEFHPAMILSVPLFHVSGLNVQLLSSFRPGRKVVGMYKWDAEEALELIETERITSFNGVPTMSWELVQSPSFGKYDLRSLKSAGGGGAAMAPEHSRQINKALGRTGGAAGTGYGMTETNGLGTSISGADLVERPRSCGRPIPPLVTIKIVAEDGRELPPGETGEIWIGGPMNFRGYWNKAQATAETLTNGYVRSGDIGHVDAQGFVYITDRAKDMIIRGGENIGCQEVEAVLCDHPAVSECAVFGVPDERLGECVAAVVMLRPGKTITADELKAYTMQHLARFKVPEHLWLRSERLPRIASGKIYKRGLREEAIAALEANGGKR